MPVHFDQRRRSIRLPSYDYSAVGGYFVTICAYQRECLFGEVVAGGMGVTPFGEIVRDEWLRTAIMRPSVVLDAFVVMPNHLHGIICIQNVGAHRVRPDREHPNQNRAQVGAPLRRASDSIGSIVAGFKSIVTKRINQHRDNPGAPVWQRNYYERVIRDDRELAAIRQYIADNPLRWDGDENNPDRV